jgi:hypothetical protein
MGAVAKTEREYKRTVGRLLVEMRRSGDIPYEWLADATRWMRKPTTYSSMEQALRRTAETYRRALWDDTPAVVEVWLEKDALAGVLVDVTAEWDVPLMVTRGYPSMSFLHSAALAINDRVDDEQLTRIYYFGDHDPSGVDIDRAIVQGIGESLLAITDRTNITPADAFDLTADFTRVAVTPNLVEQLGLQGRPTKTGDHRGKAWAAAGRGDSVEVDAIPATTLRAMARHMIERHVDTDRLTILRTVEEEERRGLLAIAETLDGRDTDDNRERGTR